MRGSRWLAISAVALAPVIGLSKLADNPLSFSAVRQLEILSAGGAILLITTGIVLGRALHTRPYFILVLITGALIGATLRWVVPEQILVVKMSAVGVLALDCYLVSGFLADFLRKRSTESWTKYEWLPIRMTCIVIAATFAVVSLVPYSVLSESMELALNLGPPPFKLVYSATGEEIPFGPDPILEHLHRWHADVWSFPVATLVGFVINRPLGAIRRW